MAIRNQRKQTTATLLPGLVLDLNPFSSRLFSARVMRNFVPERGRLARKTFAPEFSVKPTSAGGEVWHTRNFRYTRAGAPENRQLNFRSDGKVYDALPSWEQELPLTADVLGKVYGPFTDATGTSISTGTAWVTPSNIGSSNDVYATVTVPIGSALSQILLADNLGFVVPSGETVTGVVVNVEVAVTSGDLSLLKVFLMDGAIAIGADKEITGIPATDTTYVLGSSTDLWDAGLTTALINSAGFGVGVRAQSKPTPGTDAAVQVDVTTVTVYTTTGALPTILVKRPYARQLSNRIAFSDGISSKIWDGRGLPRTWGIARTTTVPVVTAVAGGTIAAATGVKAAYTWVILDEEGNRVHESSRSNLNASFVVISGANGTARVDITGITAPTHATHWSAYLSELDGSEILRRSATTRVAVVTTDITAFPAATQPRAPVRNDPPPATTVGWIAKNRHWVRDDANPQSGYFSAVGEVKGLSNGAPDESFPGVGANSVSDIVNVFDVQPDREMRCGVEHENIVFVWSEKRCFAFAGTLNLLDDRFSRDLRKLQIFSENCAGPSAAVSTPFGLAFMNSGRRILLWAGGQRLLDIGEPIQASLDLIPANETANTYMEWWSGNGRQWLIVNCKCSTPDNDTDSGEKWRAFVYDFSRPSERPGQEPDAGSWFEWVDTEATCSGVYTDNDGMPFLLMGDAASQVRIHDVVANPAHLERSAVLGKTYLGSAVQNNPRAVMRTGLILPAGDNWSTVQYLAMLDGAQAGPGVPAAGSLANPTLTTRIDIENPDTYTSGIALTFDTANTSGDKKAWLVPESTGNTNVGGALGKQFVFEVSYTAGNDSTGEADGRLTTRQNSIYKTALTATPQPEDAV